MTSKTFVSGTVIDSAWLNDVNTLENVTVPALASSITTLNGATGAASVGYTPAGTGAVATTVQNAIRTLVQLPTNNFYSELGANVNKLADRVFIGGASRATGTNIIVQGDWLTSYQLARGRTNGFMQSTQSAILQDTNDSASIALLVGSQTNLLVDNYNAIGLTSVAASNKITGNGLAYAGYFEAYRNIGAAGGAYGLETDTMNYVGLVSIDPYQQSTGQTIGVQIAAGGEYSPVGQFDSSAAINIRNNGAKFKHGILFGSDSLNGNTGSAGTGIAVGLGYGHILQWYASAGVPTTSIGCYQTSASNKTILNFIDNSIAISNNAGNPIFQISYVGTDDTYLSLRSGAAGIAPAILVSGTASNLDLVLIPKGTGNVQFGTYTASVVAQAGYITVKDIGGTIRRLLVG